MKNTIRIILFMCFIITSNVATASLEYAFGADEIVVVHVDTFNYEFKKGDLTLTLAPCPISACAAIIAFDQQCGNRKPKIKEVWNFKINTPNVLVYYNFIRQMAQVNLHGARPYVKPDLVEVEKDFNEHPWLLAEDKLKTGLCDSGSVLDSLAAFAGNRPVWVWNGQTDYMLRLAHEYDSPPKTRNPFRGKFKMLTTELEKISALDVLDSDMKKSFEKERDILFKQNYGYNQNKLQEFLELYSTRMLYDKNVDPSSFSHVLKGLIYYVIGYGMKIANYDCLVDGYDS